MGKISRLFVGRPGKWIPQLFSVDLHQDVWRMAKPRKVQGWRPKLFARPSITFEQARQRYGTTEADLRRLEQALTTKVRVMGTFLFVCYILLLVNFCWGMIHQAEGIAFWVPLFNCVAASLIFSMFGFLYFFQREVVRRREIFPWWETFLEPDPPESNQPKKSGKIVKLMAIFLLAAASANFVAGGVGVAMAADVPDQAWQLEQYRQEGASDPASVMLGEIFGNISGILTGHTETPLGSMFCVFNAAVFAVAILFCGYTMGVGVIATTHEGEVMGRRMHNFWMPARLVMGSTGLVPIVAGWSVVQIFLLQAAQVGVGIGNHTWQAGMRGMVTMVHSPLITPAAAVQDDTIQALVQAQMCTIGYNDQARTMADSLGQGQQLLHENFGRVPVVDGGGWTQTILTYGGDGKSIPFDLCGGVRLPLSAAAMAATKEGDGLAGFLTTGVGGDGVPFNTQAVSDAHFFALSDLAHALWPISEALYRDNKAPDPQKLADLRNNYVDTVAEQLGNSVLQADGDLQDYLQRGEGKSWINAGTVFNRIAEINRSIMRAADIQLEVVAPDPIATNFMAGALGYEGAQRAAVKYEGYRDKVVSGKLDLAHPDATMLVAGLRSSALETAMSAMTSGADDLFTGTINLGYALVAGAVEAYTGGVATMWVAEKLLGILPGDNPTAAPMAMINLMQMVLLPLAIAGCVMAFYLPFVPFIIWHSAVLSWLIVVVEAVVAAPLWMLAHMDAEGEGMPQRTAHGYMFILNLLFRPTLMLFGLVLAWALMWTFGGFLKSGLSILFGSGGIGFSGMVSVISFVAACVVFAMLSMMVVFKSFSLIHVIPAQVFAWVGGHFGGTGVDEAEQARTTIVGGLNRFDRSGRMNKGNVAGKGSEGKGNNLE